MNTTNDEQGQILAIILMLYFIIESLPLDRFLNKKKDIETKNRNKKRKYKRVADYCEKFSVGCLLIGLFQSSKFAILLSITGMLYIVIL